MLTAQEHFVQSEIKKLGGLREIEQAMDLIKEYAEPSYCYYKSKNLRLDEWNPDNGEVYEIVLAIFTATLTNKTLTYQQIVGMLHSRVGLKDVIDSVKVLADVIALVGRTGLITVSRTGSGNYIMISTCYSLGNIPEPVRNEIVTKLPPLMVKNRHPENEESLILGHSKNYHKGNICLDHLNRMNSVELKLNRPFLRKYEEAPTFAFDHPDPKIAADKKSQWENFIKNSYRAYIKLARGGNRFHLEHKYDKRGRTYATGYHISTQGSSFKKAIIQLADAELVEG
jgi:hypothetical protein